MPEQLSTADGHQLDLDQADQEFAAAMAAPSGGEPEAPAPPRREPVDPEAPYGRRLDGTPKKAPGGRPPRPREIEAPAAGGGSGKPGESRKTATGGQDYTQGLAEFAEALWMVLAATPVPHPELRIRIRAQAHVLKANTPGLASGVNMMAQHNGTIRAGVEKLTMGSAGWVLPAVMAVTPFAVQSAALWRAPTAGDMADIAAQVETDWQETLDAMKAEFAAEHQAAEQAEAA